MSWTKGVVRLSKLDSKQKRLLRQIAISGTRSLRVQHRQIVPRRRMEQGGCTTILTYHVRRNSSGPELSARRMLHHSFVPLSLASFVPNFSRCLPRRLPLLLWRRSLEALLQRRHLNLPLSRAM